MTTSDKEILHKRAISNACNDKRAELAQAECIDTLEFALFNNNYALRASYASKVHYLREITRIPGAPPFVQGVINLRGDIISLVNLQSLLNIKERGLTELNRVVVISNGTNYFGLICDKIHGIAKRNISELSHSAANSSDKHSLYSEGIFCDNTILLNAEYLLNSPEIIITKHE